MLRMLGLVIIEFLFYNYDNYRVYDGGVET